MLLFFPVIKSQIYLASPSAVAGFLFTMTCSVSWMINIVDEIEFWRKLDQVDLIAQVTQNMSECSPDVRNGSDSEIHYTALCGGGTNDSLSAVKNYTLTIDPVTKQDQGLWWCQLKFSNMSYETVTLKLKGENENISRFVVISFPICPHVPFTILCFCLFSQICMDHFTILFYCFPDIYISLLLSCIIVCFVRYLYVPFTILCYCYVRYLHICFTILCFCFSDIYMYVSPSCVSVSQISTCTFHHPVFLFLRYLHVPFTILCFCFSDIYMPLSPSCVSVSQISTCPSHHPVFLFLRYLHVPLTILCFCFSDVYMYLSPSCVSVSQMCTRPFYHITFPFPCRYLRISDPVL